MTEATVPPGDTAPSENTTGSRALALLKEVAGKNQFDDRIDTQPDVTTVEALGVIGRSVRLIGEAPGLFTAKMLLAFVAILPGLLLPWMGKILIDNAMLQQPFGTTEVNFPPFMDPILGVVQGRDPMGIALALVIIYFVLLFLFGRPFGWHRCRTAAGGAMPPPRRKTRSARAEARREACGACSSSWSAFGSPRRSSNRLRSRLFDRLTHLPMTVLDDQRTGDGVYRVLYDTADGAGSRVPGDVGAVPHGGGRGHKPLHPAVLLRRGVSATRLGGVGRGPPSPSSRPSRFPGRCAAPTRTSARRVPRPPTPWRNPWAALPRYRAWAQGSRRRSASLAGATSRSCASATPSRSSSPPPRLPAPSAALPRYTSPSWSPTGSSTASCPWATSPC